LTKPFTKDELKTAINKSLDSSQKKTTEPVRISGEKNDVYGEIIGASEKINGVIQIIERVKDDTVYHAQSKTGTITCGFCSKR